MSPQHKPLQERAERNLSAIVVAIEFTLISVMVGVILFPLMDFATPILRDLKFEYMPYIVSGLVIILYIWTEVIAHSLSFIGWPIDIFHNLLYIVLAMVLAIQMHFLADPQGWFAMTVISATVAAAVTLYDRRVIEHRKLGSTGAAARVFGTALTRQNSLVRITPLTVGNAVFQLLLIVLFPVLFIEFKLHLVLVAIQIAAFVLLITRTLRAFRLEQPQILDKTVEELESEMDAK
jgi:hypothetical protein